VKNVIFYSILLCFVFVTSCKKTDTKPFTNTWSFLGNNYTVESTWRSLTVAEIQTTGYDSMTGARAYLNVYFHGSYPTQGGSYRIVTGTSPAAVNEVAIIYSNSASQYYALGTDNVNASVSVTSAGKIQVTIPPVLMQNAYLPIDNHRMLIATAGDK
jgi:hypothetical protein